MDYNCKLAILMVAAALLLFGCATKAPQQSQPGSAPQKAADKLANISDEDLSLVGDLSTDNLTELPVAESPG